MTALIRPATPEQCPCQLSTSYTLYKCTNDGKVVTGVFSSQGDQMD